MERIFAETIALHVLLYALMLGNRNMYEAVLPYRRHSRHETHGKGVSFFFPLPVFLGAAFSWNQPFVGSLKSATNRLGPFLRPSARLFPTGKLPSGDAYPFQNVWRGRKVHDRIQERCIRIGQYIADTGATVRGAARHFGVSKSSVHKDMDERLPRINQTLYRQVRRVLSYNKSVRHLRGGEATRRKYLHR